MNSWSPFVHAINRWCQAQQIPQGVWGVGVSGGVDSMVLAETLRQIAPHWGGEIVICHIHHGGENRFRRESLEKVQSWARREGLRFVWRESAEVLSSEDEMRNFRRQSFAQWQTELGLSAFFLAHHADDLLETRLMRLMRGTGALGLEAMVPFSAGMARPFLNQTRREIVEFAQDRGLSWLEDPSNRDGEKYLRNWVRNDLLPLIEARSPGAVKGLSRSLELILEELELAGQNFPPLGAFDELGRMSLDVYLTLSRLDQRRVLAVYLRKLGQYQFSLSQLEEIQRHLDNSKNDHTFNVAGCVWNKTLCWIEAKPRIAPR